MRQNWTFRRRAGRERTHPTTGHSPGVWAGLAVGLAASMVIAGFAAVDPARPLARLSTISAKVGVRGASVLIVASEPVAYVTARPDPLTVLVDLRNVTTAGVSNRVMASPVGPVAAVTVEDARASDGAAVARVRVLLAAPAQHQVHSDRNVIQVDVLPDDDAAVPVRVVGAAATRLEAVRTNAGGRGVEVTLAGNGSLVAGSTAARPADTAAPPPAIVPAAMPRPQQPPVQQPPQQGTPPAAATSRIYSGHPVSLDFQGSDLRSVLRAFSEISGLNLVIDPAVQGNVDVTLRDVPWDQALENILRSNRLGYVLDGTIVRIAPLAVLAEEEKARRSLSDEQALSGELKVMTKTLSYAQAVDLEPLLKGNALSNRGTTAVDRRTNTIVINDLPPFLTKAEALLTLLDQPEGQVEIEARIVSTSKTFARELGVNWGFAGQAVPELGNTTSLAFPNKVVGSGSVDPGGLTKPSPNIASLLLGSVNGAFNLNMALSALEKDGRVKVLLQPRVVTQNNVKARITRGQEIPYTTTIAPPIGGGGGVIVQQPMPTVQFKTAALTLEVTPRITPADTILLEVDVDNGSPGEVQANGNVSINTQRAQTRVLVQNGATTVIGGIYSSQENRTDRRTPGLGRIPLLRWLFKTETINDTNEELLIFITPRIIKFNM
jgi:type IV pilus assembly protein PilQ